MMKQQQNKGQGRRVDVSVKMVKPDVAVVLSNLALKGGNGASKGDTSLATFVMVKAGGQWRITACEVAPGAPAQQSNAAHH